MRSRTSLAQAILLVLEKSIDGAVRFEDFTYNTHIYAAGYDRPIKKSALTQSLKRLRENGQIEKDIDQGKIIWKLTHNGQNKVELNQIFDNSKWDGKWRIVIFDIPEQRRAIRLVFRRKLKNWGFKLWQKSVWASKKNCTKSMREFIKEVGIEKWVLVIESDNVGEFTF